MAERNHLSNGRFSHNLDQWTLSGVEYSAGDGDDHYGVAVLSTGGDYLEQTFAVPRIRTYLIHLSVKAVGGDLSSSQCQLVISDGEGNTVVAENLSGTADTWTENTVSVGLAPGTTYTLKIINNTTAGDVKVDDVWLWFVPLTRTEIASRIDEKLGRLADDRSLSTTASGLKTEGDYTYSIDAGLRSVGAINPETGLPDVRYLGQESIQTALDYAEKEILEQLQRDYAVEVDITVGPRRENLSQIGKAVGGLIGGKEGKSSGRVVMRKMIHPRREDFEL